MTQPDKSQEYLHAAGRKIKIAIYHQEALRDLLERWTPRAGPLPIAMQAHFEGVLYAFIAAADQLAEGIEFSLGRGGDRPNLDRVLQGLPDGGPWRQLREWDDAAIVKDVRAIRRRATHHHYQKVLRGFQVEVELPPTPVYDGLRTLGEYTAAAVAHLRQLEAILEAVEQELSCRVGM